MMKGRNCYAVDTAFPLVVAFIDRSLGTVKRCHLTELNMMYTEMENRALSNRRRGGWVEGQLVRLRSEI